MLSCSADQLNIVTTIVTTIVTIIVNIVTIIVNIIVTTEFNRQEKWLG